MLMERDVASLLVVDVQARLLPAVVDKDTVLANVLWLMRLSGRMEVPVVVSEHYPQGLGHSDPAVLAEAAPEAVVGKVYFSCVADGCLENTATMARRQVVVCGMEAHVCVLQTALELHSAGKEVFVVEDAIGSRSLADKAAGVARMRAAGITIVTREMVAFEWLKRAGTDEFRLVMKEFIR
ncbi:MAG: isochorismatase family protein [Zoogloea sp.]|nr:isochorismatase family protein [Zoogloea sp.]